MTIFGSRNYISLLSNDTIFLLRLNCHSLQQAAERDTCWSRVSCLIAFSLSFRFFQLCFFCLKLVLSLSLLWYFICSRLLYLLHQWYPWPKRLKKQKLSPLVTLARNSQDYFFENEWNSHGVSVRVTYQQR